MVAQGRGTPRALGYETDTPMFGPLSPAQHLGDVKNDFGGEG